MRILVSDDALRGDLVRFLQATGAEVEVDGDGLDVREPTTPALGDWRAKIKACVAIWRSMHGGVQGVEILRDS